MIVIFDRIGVHFYVAVVWIILFLLLWFVFQNYLLKTDHLNNIISIIEDNILGEDWTSARININELKEKWNQKKIGVQFNNGTQTIVSFERTMAELDTSIKHEEDDALQYIGGLRQDLKDISKVFPGP